MEPLTAVARLSADKCEIWAGCQFHTIDQANAAIKNHFFPTKLHVLVAGDLEKLPE